MEQVGTSWTKSDYVRLCKWRRGWAFEVAGQQPAPLPLGGPAKQGTFSALLSQGRCP